MEIYIKDAKGRTDFYALQKSWFDDVDAVTSPAEGYVPMDIVNEKPALREGEVLGYHFTMADGRYRREYLAMTEDDARLNKVHTYRVGDLFWWVAQRGKAQELDALLESQGLYSAAITQTTVSDDDPNFTGVLAAVQAGLGLTDEEVADALASARLT